MKTSRLHRSKSFALIVGLLCCALFVLPSCSKKSVKDVLIGSWEVQDDKSTIEFKTDGTIVGRDNGEAQSGTYAFTDATHMKMVVDLKHGERPPGMNLPDSLTIGCEVKVVDHDNIDLDLMIEMPGENTKGHTQTAHLKRVK